LRDFVDSIHAPLFDADIEEVFTKLDTDEDGFITRQDFVEKLSSAFS
jgi:Ca2+-binding EF-hand superfamily protein